MDEFMKTDAANPSDIAHLFIINPKSFLRKADFDSIIPSIENVFDHMEGCRYSAHISRYPRDAIGVVNRYIKGMPPKQPVRVYAVGGDGILYDCLNAIAGNENAELAPIPYGFENDFVRSFGEGREGAFRDIGKMARAPSIPADAIYCDGNYALNFCSVGIESISVLWRNALLKRYPNIKNMLKPPKSGLYYLTTFLGLLSEGLRSQQYGITADGERLDGQYAAIHIANGPCYGKTLTPSGESLPDDGVLELILCKKNTPFDTFRYLPVLGNGRHTDTRHQCKNVFIHRRVRSLEISSDDPMTVCLDGEVYNDGGIKLRILPGAVRIVVPDGARFHQRTKSKAYGNAVAPAARADSN